MKHQRTKLFLRGLALLLGGIVVVFVICGGMFWLFMFPFLDPCANDNLHEVVSPNGALKAVRFRRDCGATTGYSTHISILPSTQRLPNKGGNVFVVGEEPMVVVRWIDDRHLSISGGGASASFLHLTDFRGIRITYD